MLENMTIKAFMKDLSSESPAPGGGAAAAVTAALSAALCSMVFNLTIGKKCYDELSENDQMLIKDSLISSEAMMEKYLQLMQKDAEAFLSLIAAFKLPKATEGEKQNRSKLINEGYENALNIPRELAKNAMNLYACLEVASKLGNKNVVSDAGVAAILIDSAIESAVLNIRVNLPNQKDVEQKQNLVRECEELLSLSKNRKNLIMEIVNSKI